MPQYELTFRDYLRIIRRRIFVIIATFLSIFIATIIYNNLQTPIYQASASIKITERRTVAGALLEYITYTRSKPLATEAKIIKSRPIVEKTAQKLGLIKEATPKDERERIIEEIQESMSAKRIEGTNIVKITVTLSKRELVAQITNTVAEVYIEEDLKEKNKQVRNVREFVGNQLADVEAKLKESEDRLTALKEEGTVTGIAIPLENKLADLKSKLSDLLAKATEKHPQVIRLKEQIKDIEKELKLLPAGESEFARLSRDVNVNEKLYTLLRERYEEARIAEAEKVEDVSIVNYAVEPHYPIKPNKKLGMILGSMVGILLGFSLAFVTESLDTSIGTIEDVETVTGLSVLGVVPHVRAEEKLKRTHLWWQKGPLAPKMSHTDEARVRLITHYEPKSSTAEAYRILRTNLQSHTPGKTILITSAGPREGKTTILVNLAVTMAQMGSKVLLISSDLRKPTLYYTFGIKREPGLTEVLTETIEWERAIKGLSDILMGKIGFDEAMKTPGFDNLSIITSGRIPLNPSELLGSDEMAKFIERVKEKFDIILFDSPPVLPITDAVMLAPKLDSTILVYESGRTARAALLRAKTQLENIGSKVIGVVLNHIKPETEFYATYPYYSHYKYRYYGEKGKKKRRETATPEEKGPTEEE